MRAAFWRCTSVGNAWHASRLHMQYSLIWFIEEHLHQKIHRCLPIFRQLCTVTARKGLHIEILAPKRRHQRLTEHLFVMSRFASRAARCSPANMSPSMMPTAQMSPGNQNSAVVHSAINADAVEPSGGRHVLFLHQERIFTAACFRDHLDAQDEAAPPAMNHS